jgi:hypothetical protein
MWEDTNVSGGYAAPIFSMVLGNAGILPHHYTVSYNPEDYDMEQIHAEHDF